MEILSSVGLFTTSQVSFLRFSSYLIKTMLLKMNATTDFVKHFTTLWFILAVSFLRKYIAYKLFRITKVNLPQRLECFKKHALINHITKLMQAGNNSKTALWIFTGSYSYNEILFTQSGAFLLNSCLIKCNIQNPLISFLD